MGNLRAKLWDLTFTRTVYDSVLLIASSSWMVCHSKWAKWVLKSARQSLSLQVSGFVAVFCCQSNSQLTAVASQQWTKTSESTGEEGWTGSETPTPQTNPYTLSSAPNIKGRYYTDNFIVHPWGASVNVQKDCVFTWGCLGYWYWHIPCWKEN